MVALWLKWREVASLLVNHNIPLKSKAEVYQVYIRSVMLCGTETWVLTSKLMEACISSDPIMLSNVVVIGW